MDFFSLIALSSVPVLRLLVLCGFGTFLATAYMNILNKDARKHLNVLVFNVFIPALLFSNLSECATLDNIRSWWYLPINVIVVFLAGGLLGWIFVRIWEPEPHMRRLVIISCAAGNFGNLPLALIPAACSEKESPFGETETCIANGVAYISFGLWMAVLLVWTSAYNYLLPASDEKTIAINEEIVPQRKYAPEEESKLLDKSELQEMVDFDENKVSRFNSISLSPSTSTFRQPARAIFLNWQLQHIFTPPTVAVVLPSTRILPSLPRNARDKGIAALRQIWLPAFILHVVALFVGLIPFLRRLLIGNDAPLRFFYDAIRVIGDAMIPSMALLLGGNFASGFGSTDLRTRHVFGIVIIRLVALPAVGVVIIRGAYHLGLLKQDPLFQFVLHMQFTMPTAMTIGTITQLFGQGEKESTLILFWSYSMSTIAITLWTMVYIWILS